MAVVGTPRNYDKRFLFAVEIDGLEVAWFTTVGSLEAEITVIEQHEGGVLTAADKSLGKVKFPDITCTIGATNNRELYDWWLQVVDVAANSGLVDAAYKKNIAIVQKDRDGTTKRRWNLYDAFPMKFKAGEWDASAEENVMQEVTFAYRYFELDQEA
jgi:phage tail-like protein